MADPLRDPEHNEAIGQARRTGFWLLHYRTPLRIVLFLLILGFAAWGLLQNDGTGPTGATGIAIALAITWGIGEILWFLIDRATPDSMARPDE